MGIEYSKLGADAQRQIRQKFQQEQRERAKASKYGNVKTQRQTEKEPITFDSQKPRLVAMMS